MDPNIADQMVDDFQTGRLSRRQLIACLMAIGASGTATAETLASLQNQATQDSTNPRDQAAASKSETDDGPTFSAVSLDHLALNVTDVQRSRDWYAKHLGLRVLRDSRTSSFLYCDSGDFLALFRSDTPGMHHFSFAIPEFNQRDAADRLRSAGLTPKPRGGRMYFDDPDGLEVQVSPPPRPRNND